ncbi:MAG: glutamate synthase-related protein [Candidatus Acetothermia bacterium]
MYSIDETCIGCGTCEKVCPVNAVDMVETENGGGSEPRIDMGACTYCRACMKNCPADAIKIEESVHSDTWSREKISQISEKAAGGEVRVRGTSARRELPDFDDLTIRNAQVSRPPIDHYREPCETEISLGERNAEEPLALDIPIYIGAMSFGALSKGAKLALARGAKEAGSAVDTGEGGMLPEEREISDNLVVQYASGRFGVSADYLRSADAVELKIGQGAKAGQGGMLMEDKVSEEISDVRGTPEKADLISPARHMDIVGPEDLKMKIRQLREIVAWKVPIVVKFAAGRVEEDVKIAAKAGADAVLVDGMQGGTGAAPNPTLENAGIPTLAATSSAHQALVEVGLREEVDLVVSGGINSGSDIAKALALGADAVSISTAALVALGCQVCGLCNTGKCPYGITTQIPELEERLDVSEKAGAVKNLLKVFTEEAAMLAMLAGKTSLFNLERQDLRALTTEASEMAGIPLAGTYNRQA